MKIVLAIPCYNCAQQIGRVIGAFDKKLVDRLAAVILIDNCSTDDTLRKAVQAVEATHSPKFRVLKNAKNYGLGGTHKIAFQYAINAEADYVAIVHGDAQGDTQDLHRLLNEAEKHPEASAILGARFMKGSHLKGYSRLRSFGNRVLNLIYTVLTGRKTLDLGSGLNLFKVNDLLDRNFLAFSDAFTFNMDLLLDYFRKGTTLHYVPITWSETDQVSNAKTFRVGWIALMTVLKWRFFPDRRPLNFLILRTDLILVNLKRK
jgi:glycosyltransferase involved in cell wall biosynthesis